jgi:hypothetical protein
MSPAHFPVSLKGKSRLLTAPEFQQLAAVPVEVEWPMAAWKPRVKFRALILAHFARRRGGIQ